MKNIQQYIKDINSKRKNSGEHVHRASLQNLLQSYGVMALNDTESIKDSDGKMLKPDFQIVYETNRIGFIEAKDLNVNIKQIIQDAKDRKLHHDAIQAHAYMTEFKNLIYTNYDTFIWIIDGNISNIVHLHEPDGIKNLDHLLKEFVSSKIETINSAQELAKKMASYAIQLKEAALLTYEKENQHGKLHVLEKILKDHLMGEHCDKNKFVDMYAQTLTYGIFSARVCSNANFDAKTAHQALPKTNDFLKELFKTLVNLDEENSKIDFILKNLISLVAQADLKKILHHYGHGADFEDPIIHFYETFLKEYDSTIQKTNGVYYTPEPVVNFIVKGIDKILINDFSLKNGLANNDRLPNNEHRVQILDPATGTATFLKRTIHHIKQSFTNKEGAWNTYVKEHLVPRMHGFELMMAPYAMAHMNCNMLLGRNGYNKEERLNIYLADTLSVIEEKDNLGLTLFASQLIGEGKEATKIKRKKPIMVMLGNPPYNQTSKNNGVWIKNLMRGIMTSESGHREVSAADNYYSFNNQDLGDKNSKGLNNDYIKFIRFAHWKIKHTGSGVIGFITPNGFIKDGTFRGMREKLVKTFDNIYILNLGGASDDKGNDNVFDITTANCITFFVKNTISKPCEIKYFDLRGSRKDKYNFLNENDLDTIPWEKIEINQEHYKFVPHDKSFDNTYSKFILLSDIFDQSLTGIRPSDNKKFIHNTYHEAVQAIDAFFPNTEKNKIKKCAFKPLDNRFIIYDPNVFPKDGRARLKLVKHLLSEKEPQNISLIISSKNGCYGALVSNFLPIGEVMAEHSSFIPLYLKEDCKEDLFYKSHQYNIKPEFMKKIHESLPHATPEHIMAYVYAILNSDEYLSRFQSQLQYQSERVPRIPFEVTEIKFNELVTLGARLMAIHLDPTHAKIDSQFPINGSCEVTKPAYKDNRLYINSEQYFDNISKDLFEINLWNTKVLYSWINQRKGQVLTHDEIVEFQHIIASVKETLTIKKNLFF